MFDPHADPHGERTVRSQGAKSAADLIFFGKKGPKALKHKGWKTPSQLVRVRPAAQIRSAAPEKPCSRNGCRVLFSKRGKQPLPCLWLLSGSCGCFASKDRDKRKALMGFYLDNCAIAAIIRTNGAHMRSGDISNHG